MRKIIILTIAIYTCALSINAQSMSDFLKYEGVTSLATMAHPLSVYKSGSYTLYEDYAIIEIQYESGSTKLKVHRQGDIFTSVQVLHDSFFWQPFSAIELVKSIAVEVVEEDDTSGLLGKFEDYLQTSFASMRGEDLTCLLLTVQWFDY